LTTEIAGQRWQIFTPPHFLAARSHFQNRSRVRGHCGGVSTSRTGGPFFAGLVPRVKMPPQLRDYFACRGRRIEKHCGTGSNLRLMRGWKSRARQQKWMERYGFGHPTDNLALSSNTL